jgi:hypothetical protein
MQQLSRCGETNGESSQSWGSQIRYLRLGHRPMKTRASCSSNAMEDSQQASHVQRHIWEAQGLENVSLATGRHCGACLLDQLSPLQNNPTR